MNRELFERMCNVKARGDNPQCQKCDGSDGWPEELTIKDEEIMGNCELCGQNKSLMKNRGYNACNACVSALGMAHSHPQALVKALEIAGYWEGKDKPTRSQEDTVGFLNEKITELQQANTRLLNTIAEMEVETSKLKHAPEKTTQPEDLALLSEIDSLQTEINTARDIMMAGTKESLTEAATRFKKQFHEEFQEGDRARKENKDLRDINEKLKEECSILRQGVQNIAHPDPNRDTAILDFIQAVESGSVQVSHILAIR
jgi:hypothetical protein